jgi:hypothetical protein
LSLQLSLGHGRPNSSTTSVFSTNSAFLQLQLSSFGWIKARYQTPTALGWSIYLSWSSTW